MPLIFIDHTGLQVCHNEAITCSDRLTRPSTVSIEGSIVSAFSSPDGSCLLLKQMADDGCRILCYHWTSFNTNSGIVIPWPEKIPSDAQMSVSSIGGRNRAHIIFMAARHNLCTSLSIQITRKCSMFEFRSSLEGDGSPRNFEPTINNSLIDCHAEVWTRFPVQAPIYYDTSMDAAHPPRSVTFVSSTPSSPFSAYFSNMIKEFEHMTRKPTNGILDQILIKSRHKWDTVEPKDTTSERHAGDWFVGLFCLIPLLLAGIESDRLIPLKNGVISPQFEQSLLGANVSEIFEWSVYLQINKSHPDDP